MKPAEFVDFATWLAVQRTTTRPLIRSITSRAYYGAFHAAAEFIENLTHQKRAKHDAHIWLIDSAFADAREAGRRLEKLNSARIKADYRLDDQEPELPAVARTCIELARDVQTLLQACSAVPPIEIISRRSGAGS